MIRKFYEADEANGGYPIVSTKCEDVEIEKRGGKYIIILGDGAGMLPKDKLVLTQRQFAIIQNLVNSFKIN